MALLKKQVRVNEQALINPYLFLFIVLYNCEHNFI